MFSSADMCLCHVTTADMCLCHVTSVSDVVVGFEQTVFTVSEDVGSVELCVIVINPPDGTPFSTPFTLLTGTQGLTAGTCICKP